MQNTRGRKNEFPGWISQTGLRPHLVEINLSCEIIALHYLLKMVLESGFIEEEEVYQERAKSLPRRKSMAECIDKRILQVDEALRSRVVDTERNRKLGLSGGAKQINVRCCYVSQGSRSGLP